VVPSLGTKRGSQPKKRRDSGEKDCFILKEGNNVKKRRGETRRSESQSQKNSGKITEEASFV